MEPAKRGDPRLCFARAHPLLTHRRGGIYEADCDSVGDRRHVDLMQGPEDRTRYVQGHRSDPGSESGRRKSETTGKRSGRETEGEDGGGGPEDRHRAGEGRTGDERENRNDEDRDALV